MAAMRLYYQVMSVRKRACRSQRGFTVPELLVAIAVFGLLVLASALWLRPEDQAMKRDDAQRRLHLATMMQAFNHYYERNGKLPGKLPTAETVIGNQENEVDICKIFVPRYVSDLPYDPITGGQTKSGNCTVSGQQYTTGYGLMLSKDGKTLTLTAPSTQIGNDIRLSHTY